MLTKERQPSRITIAKLPSGTYTIHATGAFGGGYTQPVSAAKLPGAILRAWQMYSANHLGCDIIASDLPAEAQAIVDKLQGQGGNRDVRLRMSEGELQLLRNQAAAGGQSLNTWMRQKLVS